MGKIRVLIVDDSSVIRSLLTRMLQSDPEIEVVGTAPDPFVARDKLVSLQPDVMTLDVEMPRMDGLTFLSKVMEHMPTRTIIISNLTTHRSEMALKALELGAIEVVAKPAIDVSSSLQAMSKQLVEVVKAAAKARLPGQIKKSVQAPTVTAMPQSRLSALAKTTHQILVIASSTGGTEALKRVLPYLPPDLPGTVIVQHMPPVFTKNFAEQLQKLCPFEVKEAADGDKVIPGRALLAPGNYHMELTRDGAYYHVRLNQKPELHGVRPAADFLMKSAAKYAGSNAIGVVLTGMGRDGAEGLLTMKEAGSYNIAQDEASCVVFGMPKAAIDIGAIHTVLPLDQIAKKLIQEIRIRSAA